MPGPYALEISIRRGVPGHCACLRRTASGLEFRHGGGLRRKLAPAAVDRGPRLHCRKHRRTGHAWPWTDWERAIAKRFGSAPLADQLAGLKALGKKYPELDLDRVGIYGWSFGGYMSALAVLKEPGLFKAAAAGAPPTDWLDYDTHYTERYLGIPPADAAAYDEASLLPLALKLERPLLLIHGTGDDNVYFRQYAEAGQRPLSLRKSL